MELLTTQRHRTSSHQQRDTQVVMVNMPTTNHNATPESPCPPRNQPVIARVIPKVAPKADQATNKACSPTPTSW
jgi:hypothetical protein